MRKNDINSDKYDSIRRSIYMMEKLAIALWFEEPAEGAVAEVTEG